VCEPPVECSSCAAASRFVIHCDPVDAPAAVVCDPVDAPADVVCAVSERRSPLLFKSPVRMSASLGRVRY